MAKNKSIRHLIIFLILYIFWGFVFSHSVFESTLAVYISFVVLFVFYLYYLIQNIDSKKDTVTLLWIPYIAYTILGYFVKLNFQQLSYWVVCLSLIIIASPVLIARIVPYRLIYGIGVFSMTGIIIQLVFPGFYNSYISPLFKSDLNSLWVEHNYGFAGFTYQLDQTGMMLLYAEGVLLFLTFLLDKRWQQKYIRILFIILFVICVFMTGKRMLAIISIVTPILSILLTQNQGSKKMSIIIISIVLSLGGYTYLVNNAEEYSDSILVGRFARSITESKAGEDITSNRTLLLEEASNLFKESPIFGIGIGEFPQRSILKTDAHNTYMQVLCEQGIVGLVLYIVPLLYCLLYTIKKTKAAGMARKKQLFRYSLYCQLIYIIYSYSGNTNINLTGFIMYFLAIAIFNSANTKTFGNYGYRVIS